MEDDATACQRLTNPHFDLSGSTLVGLWRTNPDGRLLYANLALARILGYESPGQLLAEVCDAGRPLCWSPEDCAALDRAGSCGGPVGGVEVRLRARNDHPVWVLSEPTRVASPSGETLCYEGAAIDITERRRTQDEARQTADMLQTAFDAAPVGVSVIDPQHHIAAHNAAFAQALRLPPSGALGHDHRERGYLRSDGSPMPQAELAAVRALCEGHPVRNVETGVITDQGEVVWTSMSAAPAADGSIVAITADVTDRRQAEENLRASEQTLREVLTWALDASYKRDLLSDTYEYMGPAVEQMTGYTPDEMKALSLGDVLGRIHPEDRPAIHRVLADSRGAASGRPSLVEYRFRGRDGTYRWLRDRFTVTVDPSGRPTAHVGCVSDVTDEHRALEELSDNEAKYRVLFHNELYAVCIFDLDTLQLLDANETYTRVYGYSHEELVSGMTVHDITAEREVSDKATAQAAREGTIHIPVRYHRRKDGTVFPVEIVGGPYEWRGRRVMFALARDITDRQRMQAEIESQRLRVLQADRLQALGEMASGVAHEINQPLSGIRAFAEGVLLGPSVGWTPTPDDMRQALQDIVGQVDRITDVVDHMRSLARDDSRQDAVEFTVDEPVTAALKLFGVQMRARGVRLRTELSTALPACLGWPNAIERVVLNLLSNSRDAIDGRLALQREGAPDCPADWRPQVTMAAASDGAVVRLSVTDNGGGIPEAIVGRVFDPFFTTKPVDKGTGIGLSIARSITERHQGRIEIDNRPGSGVTFTVVLPVTAPA